MEAWLDYAVELGVSGLALGPLFASQTHGYDTVDHFRIDPRLGDEGDFARLAASWFRLSWPDNAPSGTEPGYQTF